MTNRTNSAPARATPTSDDFDAYDMRRADWAGMEDRMSEEDSAARRAHDAQEAAMRRDRLVDAAYGLAALLLFGFAGVGVVATVGWLM